MGKRPRHGRAETPEWHAWANMLARCSNPKSREYHNYGGRGITVCERWRLFANFYADMGLRPSPQHSIDRIDNDGNYEPGNCRWATRKEQMNNTRFTAMLTYQGETLSASAWAERLGMPRKRILSRMAMGWDDAKVLGTPYQRRPLKKPAPEGFLTVKETAARLGVTVSGVIYLCRSGRIAGATQDYCWYIPKAALKGLRYGKGSYAHPKHELALALHQEGWSLKQIADRLGYADKTGAAWAVKAARHRKAREAE